MVTPYFGYFTVLEAFYLLIPFAVFVLASFAIFLYLVIIKNPKWRKALFITALVPIFIVTQLTSGTLVGWLLKYRSGRIIEEIEKTKSQTGAYPIDFPTPLGIAYTKDEFRGEYYLAYTRGFMTTEEYSSESKKWISKGWND
ncbi:hypothetical protein RT717_03765 [Imperialibacter roseus]|uniref:Uncharacterized protein n=1 Tax=Imperialibacter roseus TaxID=1324217 RepID=A0ABZ0IRT6_9BACT|nr:hypothetical protein [Imperialibacter roseus]WOK07740.1 hypothetical protein RT717_03765 [Imperialibacter roseus]